MNFTKKWTFLRASVPLLLVAACGGGGSNNAIEEPSIGQAIGQQHAEVPEDTAISGRVADGYLRGATICVDINENGRCDEDEPQTISGNGGVYELKIPETAKDKPILAIVPATAIDEDTGLEIGKKLQFSTPGDKPSFVSPMTTLVHQELKNNPSLDADSAEASVLETLGMPDEKQASLFEDYVANSQSENKELSEKFNHLHQTARVIATMMGEIQDDVEAAATESGIDVSHDEETQAAVRKLVEEQVRALLPQISAAVASEILESQSIEGESTASNGKQENTKVDPHNIAGNLVVEEIDTTEIAEEIEIIKAEQPVTQASMKDIMTAGFFLLDVDCDNEYHSDEIRDTPEDCNAEYSYITLTDENELHEEHYYYDPDSAIWVKENQAEDPDKTPHMMVLVDGAWIDNFSEGPSGAVKFTQDGGAILGTGHGRMDVYATQRVLDETSVLHHLKARGLDEDSADFVAQDLTFDKDSNAYKLHIKRHENLTVLFNWFSESNEEDIDHCLKFNGNCNVVGGESANNFVHYSSLAKIQEDSQSGLKINEIFYDNRADASIDIILQAERFSDETLPKNGSISWVSGKSMQEADPDIHEQENCEPFIPADLDKEKYTEPQQPNDKNDLEQMGLICAEPPKPDFSSETREKQATESVDTIIAKSQWQVVIKDGISMIEIKVPIVIQHKMDQDNFSSLLLAEQDGFVRRGAQLSLNAVENEIGYSKAAFTTLQPIAKSYVDQE